MTWHPNLANPLDYLDRELRGECGAVLRVSQNMRGEFTVTVAGPATKRLTGLSNMSACYALNTWSARPVQ